MGGSTKSFLRFWGAASELPQRQRHVVQEQLQRSRLMRPTQEAIDRAVEDFNALRLAYKSKSGYTVS